MFSEISTERTRGTVFSYFALTGSLSALMAGGLLARPADRSHYLRDWHIFVKYPYLLPSLIAGALPASTAMLAALFIRETKPASSDYSKAALSTRELLRSPGLLRLTIMHNGISFAGFAWMAGSSYYREK